MSTEFNIRKGDMFSFLTSSDLGGAMQVVLHSCNAQGVMGPDLRPPSNQGSQNVTKHMLMNWH